MVKVITVDEQDQEFGLQERAELSDDAIVRISGLWLENSAGEVLLAQRSTKKKYDPGKWGMAVCGTVEEGETYLSNILKEAEEEIGLTMTESNLKIREKIFVDANTEHRFFFQMYSACTDVLLSELRLQAEEVEAVRWVAKGTMRKEFQQYPERFVDSFGLNLRYFSEV